MSDSRCDLFGGEHEYDTRATVNGSFIFCRGGVACFSIRCAVVDTHKKLTTEVLP